jgi:hypothetical protein
MADVRIQALLRRAPTKRAVTRSISVLGHVTASSRSNTRHRGAVFALLIEQTPRVFTLPEAPIRNISSPLSCGFLSSHEQVSLLQ